MAEGFNLDDSRLTVDKIPERFRQKYNITGPPGSKPSPSAPTLGTERLERMLVDIANGTPPPADQTDVERAMWRALSAEVREILERGDKIDIPFESPGVD